MDPVRILVSTERYLVAYKPGGIPFHKKASGSSSSEAGILERICELEAGNAPSDRLFPVHRLDRVTSGLLLFARGRKMANLIGNEFRFGRVEKYYLALSDRKPKKKQGIIAGDMEQGRRGQYILTRTSKNPAITRFQSVSISGRRPGLRLYLLHPKTGKTHQLRVAMKSLGAPILGDSLYGRYDVAREEERTYLHAHALRFRLQKDTIALRLPPLSGSEFLSREFIAALATYNSLLEGFPLFDEN